MKGTFKLFTLAVAVAALASCSNDDFERATFSADKAELTGTLGFAKGTTRSGMQEAAGYGSEEIVWTKGDKARVFTMNQLTYNAYTLVGGENSPVGKFTSESGNVLSGDKYAVTDASMVYALSADDQARPLLTMTIPSSYEVDQELMGEGIYKFPAPFWGKVNQEKDNGDGTYDLGVTFMPLIAYLRVDLANLPVGTKAIVLTTHGSGTHPSTYSAFPGEQEGFQLFSENELTFNSSTPTIDDWMEYYNSELGWVTGGKSEPLSGTLNAILSDEDFVTDWEDPAYAPETWPALGFDERLVSSDTLRIDLAKIQKIKYGEWEDEIVTKNANQIFWVPIVAQYYKDLHVIAVTEDSPLSYQWVGKELKCWSDQTFTCNDIWDLTVATLDMEEYKDYFNVDGSISTSKLSEVLLLETQRLVEEGIGRTLNVDVPEITVDGPLYIDRTLTYTDEWGKKHGIDYNFIINSISSTSLPIVESKANNKTNPDGTKSLEWLRSENVDPDASLREVTITNVPGNGLESLFVVAPTSKVILAGDAFTGQVMVRASNDKYVSGHALEPGSNHLQDATDAALIVKTSVNALYYGFYNYNEQLTEITSYTNIAEVGDIYIYAGGNEETEIGLLAISGSVEGSKEMAIRLTDVLVDEIFFPNNQNCKRVIYTTGSTAIKEINETHEYSEDTNNLFIQSYWTGQALTEKALQAGFDQEQIFTAAQLASAGQDGENEYGGQAEYQINDYVQNIWLGGATYPWVGAEVDVEEFVFDGNDHKSLRNMTLETNNTTFIDPHHCCTSCGPVRKLKVTQDLGLFRSIVNTSSATIFDVNLNDVKLVTDARIDNIGSLAGRVETDYLDLDDNWIGEVKINVNGNNIGGMIGLAEIDGNVDMDGNIVGGSVNESGYVISKLANVGGQIGLLDAEGEVTITGSVVEFDDENLGTIQGGGESYAEWNNRQDEVSYISPAQEDAANVPLSYVGGIAGLIHAEEGTTIEESKVTVANEILGKGSYVGGLAGAIIDEAAVTIGHGGYNHSALNLDGANQAPTGFPEWATLEKDNDSGFNNTVTAHMVKSENGSFAAGGVGYLKAEGGVVANENKIDVDEVRTLGKDLQGSYAAGLIGKLEADEESQASGNKIVVDKIRAYGKNAAGLIGMSYITNPEGIKIYNTKVIAATAENDGTYRADLGYVGGLIGTVQYGKAQIGCNYGYLDNSSKTIHRWPTEIKVQNMKGALAVGGAVGDNEAQLTVFAGNDYDYIAVGSAFTAPDNKNTAVTGIAPIAFKHSFKNNTEADAWYNQDDLHRQYAGSMSNVLGFLQKRAYIYDKTLVVGEISADTRKNAIRCWNHRDEQHTQAENLKFWGDLKDYVGWGQSGFYYLNGPTSQWADQNYNTYKPADNYKK